MTVSIYPAIKAAVRCMHNMHLVSMRDHVKRYRQQSHVSAVLTAENGMLVVKQLVKASVELGLSRGYLSRTLSLCCQYASGIP